MLSNSGKNGFTLLELLVIMLMLAVLAAILMPALAAAKEQGRNAVCKSNIRQLFLANFGYALENDGYYVIAAEDIFSTNLKRWHGVRNSIDEPFNPDRSPLSPYIADGNVKRCPSFGRNKYYENAGPSANFEAGCGGYGYNDQYVGGVNAFVMPIPSKASARASDIKLPAATVMFTDAAFRQTVPGGETAFIEYSFCHSPFWRWYDEMTITALSSGPVGRPAPSIHFRHGRFTNVAWCDGHISRETMDLSAPYVTNAIMTEAQTAEMALGWFGPDNNNLFDLK